MVCIGTRRDASGHKTGGSEGGREGGRDESSVCERSEGSYFIASLIGENGRLLMPAIARAIQ